MISQMALLLISRKLQASVREENKGDLWIRSEPVQKVHCF